MSLREQASAPPDTEATVVLHVRDVSTQRPLGDHVVAIDTSPPTLFGFPVASGPDARWGEAAATDASGQAVFTVPARAELLAVHYGTASTEQAELLIPPLLPGERRVAVLEIEVLPAARIRGRVVGASDGAPIAGASLHLHASERAAGAEAAPVAVTDPTGHFELRRAAALTVDLRHPEPPAVAGRALRVRRQEVPDDVLRWRLWSPCRVQWEGSSSAAGRAGIEGLPPDAALSLELLDGGAWTFLETGLRLAPGEQRRIDVDLRGAPLSGHLVDEESTPLPHRTLWLVAAGEERPAYMGLLRELCSPAFQTSTGEDGGFRFDGIPAGLWWLGPEASDAAIAEVAVPVRVRSGEALEGIRLVAPTGRSIAGRVPGPDGEGVKGAQVFAGSPSMVGGVASVSGPEGAFVLAPLASGSHQVLAFSDATGSTATAMAQAGARDVILRFEPMGTVRVRATRAGRPAVWSELLLSHIGPASAGGDPWIQSSEEGAREVEHLGPGRIALFVRSPDGWVGMAGPIDPGEGSPEIHVPLEPGVPLTLRALAFPGGATHWRLWHGSTCLDARRIERGVGVRLHVPPGRLRLELRSSWETLLEREVNVGSEPAELRLE